MYILKSYTTPCRRGIPSVVQLKCPTYPLEEFPEPHNKWKKGGGCGLVGIISHSYLTVFCSMKWCAMMLYDSDLPSCPSWAVCISLIWLAQITPCEGNLESVEMSTLNRPVVQCPEPLKSILRDLLSLFLFLSINGHFKKILNLMFFSCWCHSW